MIWLSLQTPNRKDMNEYVSMNAVWRGYAYAQEEEEED